MSEGRRVRLLLGTRKGICFLESDAARDRWQARGPFLAGWATNHVCQDPRDGTISAASYSCHYGPLIAWTRNGGTNVAAFERGAEVRPGREVGRGEAHLAHRARTL